MNKKVRDYLAVSCLAIGAVCLSGCSNDTTANKTSTLATPKVTASPSASGEEDAQYEEYKVMLSGTWTSSSNTTYTFDLDNNYTSRNSNESFVGTYWFTTDDTGEMVILCLKNDTSFENSYFKLAVNSGSSLSVINGDGETETWTKK